MTQPRPISATPAWRPASAAASSSPGRAPARTALRPASSGSASRARRTAGRRVPGQHLHHDAQRCPAAAARRRRSLRHRLAELRSGRRRLRRRRVSASPRRCSSTVDGDVVGARAAETAEVPITIGLAALAALWVVRRFGLRRSLPRRHERARSAPRAHPRRALDRVRGARPVARAVRRDARRGRVPGATWLGCSCLRADAGS